MVVGFGGDMARALVHERAEQTIEWQTMSRPLGQNDD